MLLTLVISLWLCGDFLKILLSRKSQETEVVSFVIKHIVSDHCEATDLNGKSHTTLVIFFVHNFTKYYLLTSV